MDTDCDSDGSMPTLDEISDSEDEGGEVRIVDEFDVDVLSSFDGASESDGSFFGKEDWFSEPEKISRNIEEDVLRDTYSTKSSSDQEDQGISDKVLAAAEPLKPGQYTFVQAELYDSDTSPLITRTLSPSLKFPQCPFLLLIKQNLMQQEKVKW